MVRSHVLPAHLVGQCPKGGPGRPRSSCSAALRALCAPPPVVSVAGARGSEGEPPARGVPPYLLLVTLVPLEPPRGSRAGGGGPVS